MALQVLSTPGALLPRLTLPTPSGPPQLCCSFQQTERPRCPILKTLWL